MNEQEVVLGVAGDLYIQAGVLARAATGGQGFRFGLGHSGGRVVQQLELGAARRDFYPGVRECWAVLIAPWQSARRSCCNQKTGPVFPGPVFAVARRALAPAIAPGGLARWFSNTLVAVPSRDTGSFALTDLLIILVTHQHVPMCLS